MTPIGLGEASYRLKWVLGRGQSVDFLCKQYFPVLFPSLGSVVFVDSASATAEKDVEEWVTTRRAVACPASPAARDRRSRG